MLYTLPLNREYTHRIACHIHFKTQEVQCIVDTGCMNTLVPLQFAQKYGNKLNKSYTVVVGGKIYSSVAYSFDSVTLAGYHIPKLLAFCANYTGALRRSVLLGLNVMNNLKYTISRNQNTLDFEIDLWNSVKDKKYPFTMFFDMNNYMKPVYPGLLVEADSE